LTPGSGPRSREDELMTRIAVSGHRGLPAGTVTLVSDAIRAALRETGPGVVGLSCLADGADQLFAQAVLDAGGQIEAVVPAAQYRDGLPAEALGDYDKLIARAVTVHRMPFAESTAESHMTASKFMISRADQLWAVWDGQPARGYGGTADVAAYARDHGVAVRQIWPEGARRD
jgi:hypothetical protein